MSTEVCFACTQSTVDLDVELKGVESGTDKIVFNLLATSAGKEVAPADNINNLTLPLTTLTDIGVLGQVISIIQYFTMFSCE